MFERLRNRFDARVQGALLCAVGLLLLAGPSLVAGALGLEFVAMAFWCWARSADDAIEQVNRWAWLRRPAQGLWLAAAVVIGSLKIRSQAEKAKFVVRITLRRS